MSAIQRAQRGFTLLELMIVVTVVGILAAIAIPSYQSYVMRAKVSEGFTLASGAKAAVAHRFIIEGDFPANNSEAGLSPPEQLSGRYVDSVAVQDGGAIRATYSDPAIAGESITLTPSGGRSVSWTCTSTLSENYLPASCSGGTSLPPGDEDDDGGDDGSGGNGNPGNGNPGNGNGNGNSGRPDNPGNSGNSGRPDNPGNGRGRGNN